MYTKRKVECTIPACFFADLPASMLRSIAHANMHSKTSRACMDHLTCTNSAISPSPVGRLTSGKTANSFKRMLNSFSFCRNDSVQARNKGG